MFRWQWNYKFLLEIEIWGCFCYWWFVTFVLCPSNKHSNLEIVFWKKEYKVIYNLCYVKYRNFALQSAICSKLFINCAFPQNFHTSKLGEMLLFCALLHCMRCQNTEFFLVRIFRLIRYTPLFGGVSTRSQQEITFLNTGVYLVKIFLLTDCIWEYTRGVARAPAKI